MQHHEVDCFGQGGSATGTVAAAAGRIGCTCRDGGGWNKMEGEGGGAAAVAAAGRPYTGSASVSDDANDGGRQSDC